MEVMHTLPRRLFGVALLPLVLLASGLSPGSWHCADGSLCESGTALACCCGRAETGAQVLHRCEDAGAQLSPADECGCYYLTQGAEAVRGVSRVELAASPALPVERTVFTRPKAPGLCKATPPACHGPPGCVLPPGITRGPPAA